MTAHQPIRLGIIGAGLFARDVHWPSIQALGDAFEVVAVCSRTTESASALAKRIPGKVDITTDAAALLARQDIEAVDIVMPIPTMPAMVEAALKAGKHVISEKPVAPDVASGRKLLSVPREGLVWMVAENHRYEAAFVHAADIVRAGLIGKPMLCHWASYILMNPSNKYYTTAWRRTNEFPGGYLLDGGVHWIATLRMVLGEIASVTASTAQNRDDLPPADTLSAALRFENGALGVLALTFNATQDAADWPSMLHVAGDKGALRVGEGRLEIAAGGQTRTPTLDSHSGVLAEFAAFAAAIRRGVPHRNAPEQALQDVAVLEAMLKAAQTGCAITPERVV